MLQKKNCGLFLKLLALRATREKLENVVHKVYKARLVRKVHKVSKANEVQKVLEVQTDFKVQSVLKVFKENEDKTDKQVPKRRSVENKDKSVLLVLKVQSD